MAYLDKTGLTYFYGKIKDIFAKKADIPTALSQLGEDTSHRVVTDTEKAAWNAKSDFSGSYHDLTNKPSIPSAYSHPSTHPASMITGLSTVATSGSYNDLSNKPTIPTIPSSLPANGGNADTVDSMHIRKGTSGADGYITFVV